MKKLAIALLVISFTFLSCSSDNDSLDLDNETETPSDNVMYLIKKEDFNADGTLEDLTEYFYNEDDLLVKTIETSPNGYLEETNYIYSAGDLVADISSNNNSYEYTYNNGLVSKRKQTTSNGQIEEFYYSYNPDDLLILLQNINGVEKHEYFYDSENNLVRDRYTNNGTVRESKLEYDNKSNYYKHFFPDNFEITIRAGEHNVVKITYENEITEYEYEYNSNGYPITSTEIGNGVITEFSKYYYD